MKYSHHRNHNIRTEIEKNLPALIYLNSVHNEAPLGIGILLGINYNYLYAFLGYFESGMDPANAVVKRHQSLIKNREFLQEELAIMTDKVYIVGINTIVL